MGVWRGAPQLWRCAGPDARASWVSGPSPGELCSGARLGGRLASGPSIGVWRSAGLAVCRSAGLAVCHLYRACADSAATCVRRVQIGRRPAHDAYSRGSGDHETCRCAGEVPTRRAGEPRTCTPGGQVSSPIRPHLPAPAVPTRVPARTSRSGRASPIRPHLPPVPKNTLLPTSLAPAELTLLTTTTAGVAR